MKAILTVTDGLLRDRQVVIEPGLLLTIGRGKDAGLVVGDQEASRLHCVIFFADGVWVIEDRQSLNGVHVNGKRVPRAVLQPGDTIRVGRTMLRFDFATAVSDSAPASPNASTEPGKTRLAFAPPKIVRVTAEDTIQQFVDRHPLDASNIVLAWWQKIWYLVILLALIALVIHDHLDFLHIVHFLCLFYLVVIGYKLVTIFLSVIWPWEIRPKPAELAALTDAELPAYTILVPLYKESEVAEKIVRHISALDYPKNKLDVKILLEPDDPQTLAAIQSTGLPEFCDVIICPNSQPKTKPKACNHGLARAIGEFTVIYDAEDRPEPDQLKKAVVAFRKADERWERRRRLRHTLTRTAFGRRFFAWLAKIRRPDRGRTVCLQAKLHYYNPKQNLLTRWFTIEYSTWFDLYLPGLNALRAPIPLGGTSNHFRTGVLRHIGGWDPFNVTEDCDLGMRIHKLGYRTEVFDTVTWEEANSKLGNWLRQRSRWVKGYLQTHFTHMRHPARTLWQLRPWGMFHFLNSVGGLAIMLLLNPIFWASSLLYVGLFAVDLHQHGYSIEKTLGVNESVQDVQDGLTLDRTIRVPNVERHAWPMICGALPETLDPDLPWTRKLKLILAEDWRYSWHEIWTQHQGFHFWNLVSQVFFVCTVILVFGNVLFVLMHVAACIRGRMPGMIPFALLMPLYWILISVGAWKGFLQLFWKPFYWEKTRHGLDAP